MKVFYFFFIPLIALMSRIIFLRNGFNYTEHLVIYLYTMSLSAIVSALIAFVIIITVPQFHMIWGLLFNVIMVIYHAYALKRIFDLSISQIILKTLLFILVFFGFYFLMSFALVLILMTFTDFDFTKFSNPNS